MDNKPMAALLFFIVESRNISSRWKSTGIKKKAVCVMDKTSNIITLTVKSAGPKWTGFKERGCLLNKFMRAIPELYTCLKNCFRLVRLL